MKCSMLHVKLKLHQEFVSYEFSIWFIRQSIVGALLHVSDKYVGCPQVRFAKGKLHSFLTVGHVMCDKNGLRYCTWKFA